jgi:glycosyltransferase involved in cell wall biosynthesis
VDGVYLVGLRYPHHAQHSGYDGFARHVGTHLALPLAARRLPGRAGAWVDAAVVAATRDATYSLGVLLGEGAAAAHMARRRDRVYHVLYGDRDLWLLGKAGRRRGHRLVASFHKPPSVLERYVDRHRRVVGDLDSAVLVSATQRPYFEALLPPERVHVVPHGVDTAFFSPAAVPRTGPPLCVTVGSHLRDFETFEQTLRLVFAERPDARVLAIGTGGQSRDAARFSPPPGGQVEAVAHLSDEELRDAYRRASAVVFPYRDATASIALLEAMACGAPVVATAVGGIGEYLPAGAGVLCAPRRPEAMAEAVLGLLEDPARAAALGAAGREHVLRFDYAEVAGALRGVYEAARRRPV